MTFANTEDPWIDYLIISRLGGCYVAPIIQIFQDGRFRIKIDPHLESATQTKARGLLSYGPPWAHYLGGYQDRLLSGPLGPPGLRYTAPEGVEHKDYTGVVLG
jgi:hypothetical protein